MLETIENKLLELGFPVYYGTAGKVDNSALWDYIVFNRNRTVRSQNRTGYSDYFQVALIHENFIPVGIVETIVEKMESISGMRLAHEDIQYTYTEKESTKAVVELAVMNFVCPRKRVQ